MQRFIATAAWAALGLSHAISAQTVKYCSPSDSTLCYSVNVPDQTASSGTGDIFFQIQGPASRQWIGLGQGEEMAGANIFVIYADASGNNVTLSPRLGTGHREPEFNSEAQVFLLDGTGIANGMMTANVRCSNCASWTGGKMDLTSATTSWIWAAKDGTPIRDSSQSAEIERHSQKSTFMLDLTKARGGSSLNPFTTSTSTSSSPAASGASSGEPELSEAKVNKMRRSAIAHGTLMGLAFVIFYPSGAIAIRLFSFPGVIWLHAGIQAFAYCLSIAGLGLGAWIATTNGYKMDKYHEVIGLIVLGFFLTQFPTGWIHHNAFKKYGKPSWWTRAHVIVGRVMLTLGLINGGLGLRYADNTVKGEIAYGVLAGLVWIVWMAVAVWGTRFKRRESVSSTEKVESHPSPK